MLFIILYRIYCDLFQRTVDTEMRKMQPKYESEDDCL